MNLKVLAYFNRDFKKNQIRYHPQRKMAIVDFGLMKAYFLDPRFESIDETYAYTIKRIDYKQWTLGDNHLTDNEGTFNNINLEQWYKEYKYES